MIYRSYYPYYYPPITPYPISRKSAEPKKSALAPKKALPEKEEKRKEEREIETQNTEALFEIFGIKLYFDDILLICLIFFLYNEGVQDQYLFIALILLLLS